eukprot:8214332-Pyramimonas_sp.AAC.1
MPLPRALMTPRTAIQYFIEGVGVDEVGGRGKPAKECLATFGGLLSHRFRAPLNFVANHISPNMAVPVPADDF